LGSEPNGLEEAKSQVISLIRSGNYAEADTAVEQLKSQFEDTAAKAKAIQDIAAAYKDVKDYHKSIELSRYVLANWPDGDDATWSQMHIAFSYVALGDIAAGKLETEKLISNYAGNANLPWVVHIMADVNRWLKNYAEAEELYKYIVEEHPDSEWAEKARLNLAGLEVLLLVESGDYGRAQEALNKLKGDFAGNPELAVLLEAIGDMYKWSERYDEAEQLYRQAAEERSTEGPEVAGLELDVCKTRIMALIEAGRDAEAGEAIDQMVGQFSGEPNLPETVYWFGRRYEWSGKFDKARSIYQHLIQQYAGSSFADVAEVDIAKGRILVALQAVDDRQALRMADKLIEDFSKDAFLCEAADRLMQALAAQEAEAGLAEVVSLWRGVLQELPSSDFAAWGRHLAASCYRRQLNDCEKAIQCYEKVVEERPGYRYAGEAQFAMVGCYERLAESGDLDESEAAEKKERAYRAVAENYPDSVPAGRAFLELGWLNFKRGNWLGAAEHFERALARFPQDQRPRHILYPLGRAYEEMGELDKAARVYGEFLETVPADDPRVATVTNRLEDMPATEQ